MKRVANINTQRKADDARKSSLKGNEDDERRLRRRVTSQDEGDNFTRASIGREVGKCDSGVDE